MSLIIDSHAHVFPDPLSALPMGVTNRLLPEERVSRWKKNARSWWSPFAQLTHQAQTFMRHLPEPARNLLDELGALVPVGTVLIESTLRDFTESMNEAGVKAAVIIAHPPAISNEFVLELGAEDRRLLPVVNFGTSTTRLSSRLKKYVNQGARALKIHPAADGEGPDSSRYKTLLKTAAELGLPVIIHTGCVHTHLLYREPKFGEVECFESWFEKFPTVNFILAHMNYHKPLVAMDLAERHQNVFLETSWQPSEVLGEAVIRIGDERILFGTDWPFVGQNQKVGIGRVQDAVASGFISAQSAEKILGLNAKRIFKYADET